MRCFLLIIAGFLSGVASGAEVPRLPDEWFLRPPTAERVNAILAAAPSKGWGPIATGIYAGAINTFEHGSMDAAEAWFYVAAWSELLGRSQSSAGPRPAVVAVAALPDEPLARLLSQDTIAWLLEDRVFSAAFFDQLSAYDNLPQVLVILQTLREADPRRFAAYSQLALAIALVYDSPPPRDWPHAQVSAKVLPRVLPPPLEAFNFLVDADQRGVTLHKLTTLPASELKFAVDFVASFDDLVWAQKSLHFTLAQLPKSYDSVRYRTDRLNARQYAWPGDSYDLPRIYSEGGICVDQAYFATQAGKAKGVPTLLFRGEGQDGRHAWFGYLGTGKKWVLDAGRYAEQRYVTGVAHDPQTWADLSDHELQFLSEGFHQLPPYQQSRPWELFAKLYLQLGQTKEAAAAARRAIACERRNLEAWETLLAVNADVDFKTREQLLGEAAAAFQRYPDLNARFLRALAASLRSRGEATAAETEERAIARKNQTGRTDLTVEQAAAAISQMMENTPLSEQLLLYKQTLQRYGKGAGMDFYDRVVRPFVRRLASQGHASEAKTALAQARLVLKPDPDSQLDQEMTELAEKLK